MTSIAIDRNDGLSSSTAIKGPVRVATTANITLSGQQTIDGVAVVTEDRVLVKDQTTASQNGIYVADTGSWRRAKDFEGNRDVRKGTQVFVTDGTTNALTTWFVLTANPIVIGTTSLLFSLDHSTGLADDLTIDEIGVTQFASTQLSIRPVGFSVVDPFASTWRKIATPGVVKPWHRPDITGQYWELADGVLHPFMFGNVGNAGDDTQAFQDMLDCMCRAPTDLIAGQCIIPAGEYEVDQLVLGNFPAGIQLRHYNISGYGAVLKPRSGGTSGGTMITAQYPASTGPQYQIEGLAINHREAHNHLQAIAIIGASYTKLRRIRISGGGRAASTYGIGLYQSDPANADTGAFWVTIEECEVRKDAANDVTVGILSRGSNNSLMLRRNVLTTGGGIAALIQTSPSIAYAANSLRFIENAVEVNTYGLHYAIPPSQRPFGLVSRGNRFEATDYPYRFTLDSGVLGTQDGRPQIGEDDTYLSFTQVVLNPPALPIDFKARANCSGTVTIANGASTATVTFPVTEYNNKFGISLSNAADVSLYSYNHATGGFSVGRTGTSGNLTMTWTLQPNEH